MIGASGIWKAEKTIWYPLLLGAAALLNLGLDFWLVPRYGGLGAAAATITSLVVWNLLALIVSERLWRVGYNYLILSAQVVIGVGGCAGILLLYWQEAASWFIWGVTLPVMVALLALAVTKAQLRTVLSLGFSKIRGK
jgi:O-antigen/teichoic acid export membrane protein